MKDDTGGENTVWLAVTRTRSIHGLVSVCLCLVVTSYIRIYIKPPQSSSQPELAAAQKQHP